MRQLEALDRKLLRAISMDARATSGELAERANCSRQTAMKRLKLLESQLQLRYTPEFDQQKLGLECRNLIAVKTERGIDRGKLVRLLKSSGIPQFAAFCEGDFNLLIYAVARKHFDYLRWSYLLRSSLWEGGNKPVFWKASSMFMERLGFFPVGGEIFGEVGVSAAQRAMLREFNRNARISLTELSRKLGISPTAVRYHLDLLLRKGYIRRFTATIGKPVGGLNAAFFIEKPFLPDHPQRVKRVRELYYLDDGKSAANRYLMVSELSGHFDMFTLANFNSIDEWYKEKGATVELFGEGTRVCGAFIADVLIGELPARNVNVKEIYDTTFRSQGVERDWDYVFAPPRPTKRRATT